VENDVAGTLVLYGTEPGCFDEEQVQLLEEVASDISFGLDHIAKEERLNYLAYYDGLTGLANRTLFQQQVLKLIHSVNPGEQGVAMAVLDLERFRNINDTMGMAAGDTVLKQLAERLSNAVGEPSAVARISADRFAVALVPMRNATEIARVLDREVLVALHDSFPVKGEELRLSIKAGVAVYPADGTDPATLLVNAEAALVKAKRSTERYLFYAPDMNARVAEQLRLENELRKAVLEEQFVLYYQPRIDLASGSVIGMEALIRWEHPERGIMSPAAFIPLLEQTGMIVGVGRWAIRRAMLDHAAWAARGHLPPRIAVNVSEAQLRREEFVEDIRNAIKAPGGSKNCIDIEITESMLMDDIDRNIAKLRAVRALGIHVAVDDFGTGYSSLSWIARLPLDSLKIDRSFIAAMNDSAEHMAVVSAVISLARALNLKVVAEGVEKEAQCNLLRLLHCDEGQGYLFSVPLPPDEIPQLRSRPANHRAGGGA
jgi:diguanylate cyclase (GGDEF)-like protein